MRGVRESLSVMVMALGCASLVVAVLQDASTVLHVGGGVALIHWSRRLRPALEGSSISETGLTGQPIAGNAGYRKGEGGHDE